MQGKLFDHGIGEQLAGQFLDGSERRAIGRPVDLKLKALSLAYAGHVAETEPMGCAEYRFTLRIVNLRLQHDVDDHSGHVTVLSRGMPPVPG